MSAIRGNVSVITVPVQRFGIGWPRSWTSCLSRSALHSFEVGRKSGRSHRPKGLRERRAVRKGEAPGGSLPVRETVPLARQARPSRTGWPRAHQGFCHPAVRSAIRNTQAGPSIEQRSPPSLPAALLSRARPAPFVSAALAPYGAALDAVPLAFAQHQGMSSSMRLLGQPWTRRVSRSAR